MAGKREKKEKQVGTPGWLLTFTGLMILIMAFFVYLVTNAALMDERRVRLAIGSVLGSFGMASGKADALGVRESLETYQPGPMPPDQDLASLKELLWDDIEEDLRFVSNRFVQIFSVNTAVLFQPGETDLTEQGRDFLRQVAPTLRNVTVPVLIAGHGSTLRDEFPDDVHAAIDDAVPDHSWEISLFRSLNVYRFLLGQGVSPDLLRMEGLGRFHPRDDSRTPEGRRNNRRVDFVLDRRGAPWAPQLERPAAIGTPKEFSYRDFIFRFPDAHDSEPIRP